MGGDELHAGAAACLLTEHGGDGVGQPGNEPGRGLLAPRPRQRRLADAERDRRRGVVGRLAANAPAPARHTISFEKGRPSALDGETERSLYNAVITRLPKAAIVSVAHRESLAAFHQHTLEMQRAA